MIINNKFSNKQSVYLITDREQKERIVISIQVLPEEGLIYLLACHADSTWHHECEISDEIDENLKMKNI